MITRDEAISMYLERFPKRLVDEVFETRDLFIISGLDRETGEELDVSPVSISKKDGHIGEFFPPAHADGFQASKPDALD